MGQKTYDPNQVFIIFNGHIVSGFADGSFLTVKRREDAFTTQVGTDGEHCRSKSNNRSGEISFKLGQWSDSNKILSDMASLDELSNGGAGALMIKDGSGTSLYTAESAWIKKVPDSEFAREAGSREWMLETGHLVIHVGGN